MLQIDLHSPLLMHAQSCKRVPAEVLEDRGSGLWGPWLICQWQGSRKLVTFWLCRQSQAKRLILFLANQRQGHEDKVCKLLLVVGEIGGNPKQGERGTILNCGVVSQVVYRVNSKPQTSWLSGDSGIEREEAQPVS